MEHLNKPITSKEIEWRVQSKGKGKTTVVPYLNARCVMNRFDLQFGPLYWQTQYERWGEKGVKCTISVYSSKLNQWVSKSDGADETHIESTKGGFSDSLKRCAVQWGLGRDLYEYPLIQINGENRFLPYEIIDRLNKMADLIAAGQFTKNYVLL